MNRAGRILGSLALLVLASSVSRADRLEKFRVETRQFAPDNVTELQSEVKEYSTWTGKGRFLRIDGKDRILVQEDAGRITMIDTERRTATGTSIADIGKVLAPMLEGMAPTLGGVKPVVKATDERRTIRGWSTVRYRMTMTLSPELQKKLGPEMSGGAPETNLWITNDIRPPATDNAIAAKVLAMFGPSLRNIAADSPKIEGVIVLSETTSVPFPGMGKQVEREELLSVEEKEPPAGTYDIPEEYRRETLPLSDPSAIPGVGEEKANPMDPFLKAMEPDSSASERAPSSVRERPREGAVRSVVPLDNADGCYTMVDLGVVARSGWQSDPIPPQSLTNSGCAIVNRKAEDGGRERGFLWRDGHLRVLKGIDGRAGVAYAVDESCRVVGAAGGADGTMHAFLWEGEDRRDLGTLGGPTSVALSVNATGTVVGISDTADGRRHAFLWDNGTMRDIGPAGRETSRAVKVNRAGQVIGGSIDEGGRPIGFILDSGKTTEFPMRPAGPLGEAENGVAVDLNDAGQLLVVGSGNRERSFLWHGGRRVELPASAEGGFRAAALGATGLVAGTAQSPTGRHDVVSAGRSVLWDGGRLLDLRLFGGVSSRVAAMSGSGLVAGVADPDSADYFGARGDGHLFLWRDGETVDVTEACGVPKWKSLAIVQVNDSGWLLARGTPREKEEERALLLLPPVGSVAPGMTAGDTGTGGARRPGGPCSRAAAIRLLRMVYEVFSARYADASMRGLDWDAAYKEALGRIRTSPDDTFAIVAEMVDRLDDPRSRFHRPGENRLATRHLSPSVLFPGIRLGRDGRSRELVVSGVELQERNFPRGIVPGDVVLAIDGTDAKGLSLSEAERRLAGPGGAAVLSLTVRRGEKELTHRLPRLPADGPSVRYGALRTASDTVGYIHVYGFDGRAEGAVRSAIGELDRSGAKAYLLDLRGNSGGQVDDAAGVVRAFLDCGVVVTISKRDGSKERFDAKGRPATRKPVVVLVDGTSFAAAEIVAAALQENGRARLVGERTPGLAAPIEAFPSYSCEGEPVSVTLRVGDLLTPKGRVLFGGGVAPDVAAEPSGAERERLWSDPARFGSSADPVARKAVESLGLSLPPEFEAPLKETAARGEGEAATAGALPVGRAGRPASKEARPANRFPALGVVADAVDMIERQAAVKPEWLPLLSRTVDAMEKDIAPCRREGEPTGGFTVRCGDEAVEFTASGLDGDGKFATVERFLAAVAASDPSKAPGRRAALRETFLSKLAQSHGRRDAYLTRARLDEMMAAQNRNRIPAGQRSSWADDSGIQLSDLDGPLEVIVVDEGSPAAKAGIPIGGRLLRIGDVPTAGMAPGDAYREMEGPPGSTVELWVARNGEKEPKAYRLTREEFRFPFLTYRDAGEGIAYVRLRSLPMEAAGQLRDAIRSQEVTPDGMRGLLLDLRNNPGGIFDQAIRVVELFVDNGVVASTVGRGEYRNRKYVARREGTTLPRFPIVVLVNRDSAAGAEIVAGSLQDQGRARLVGGKTAGVGGIRTFQNLSDGSVISLTTENILLPKGRPVGGGVGLEPDVPVGEDPPAKQGADRGDRVLDAGRAELRGMMSREGYRAVKRVVVKGGAAFEVIAKWDNLLAVRVPVGSDNDVTMETGFALSLDNGVEVRLRPDRLETGAFWSQSLDEEIYSAVRVGNRVVMGKRLSRDELAELRKTAQDAARTKYWREKNNEGKRSKEAVKPIQEKTGSKYEGPRRNEMSCAAPSARDKTVGEFACYGLWDFGDAFGDDQAMCSGDSGEGIRHDKPGVGCIASTPACSSGKAEATRVLDVYPAWHKADSGVPLATDGEVETIASRLKSTPLVVRKELIRIWDYECSEGASEGR